jgi:hypothetical protein
MGIHINSGFGNIYDKETPDFPSARINYKLLETDASKYTHKKWWGEFNTNDELKHLGNYFIEFEDNRRGECIVIANSEVSSKKAKTWYYHFNGRGALSRKK